MAKLSALRSLCGVAYIICARVAQGLNSNHDLSTAMSAQTLPEELLELVFDDLHDDKASLSRCSCVCRAWLSQSSRFLFRDLKLQPQLESPDPSYANWYEYFLKAVTGLDRKSVV